MNDTVSLRLRPDRVGLRPSTAARWAPERVVGGGGDSGSEASILEPAGCLARRRLSAAMTAWLEDRIRGKAILLAGHPGSGKTTMVQGVIENHTKSVQDRVILPVLLHGPTLFRSPGSASGVDAETALADQLFRDLAVGLYQAVRARVVQELESRASGDPDQRALFTEVAAWFRVDHEDSARVELLAVLRDLWERLGVLEHGLLVPSGRKNKGYAEIALLANLHRLHLRATGEVSASARASGESSREASERSSAELSPLRDLPSGWSGLAGGALTSGALFAGVPPWIVGVGALAGIAATSSLTLAAEYRRSVRGSRELTYKEDDSLTTYALRVPRAVEAVRELGVYPVFVLDELDKVPELPQQLLGALGKLKALVNERHALFVLITGASYFRAARESISRDPHVLEATAFGELLFVAYPISELLDYLGRALIFGGTPDPRERALRPHLFRVLLARAACHPSALEHELQRVAAPEGGLDPSVLRIDTPRYRAELVVQLAVEQLVGEPSSAAWLGDRPERLQAVYDVLFLPVRRWRNGRSDFSFDADAEAELGRIVGGAQEEYTVVREFLAVAVARLGGFLAAPATLIRPGLDAAFVEVLRVSEPLVRAEAGRWVWCRNADGRLLEGKEAAKIDGDEVVNVWRALGARGHAREDLEARGELPASPGYSAFLDAFARLRTPGDAPDHAWDAATVNEYGAALTYWLEQRIGPRLNAPKLDGLAGWGRWLELQPAR